MPSLPTVPTQVAVPLSGSGMVSKNQQKIGKAFGILSLPFVPTKVTLRGNVGYLDTPRESKPFTFDPRGQGIALRKS